MNESMLSHTGKSRSLSFPSSFFSKPKYFQTGEDEVLESSSFDMTH